MPIIYIYELIKPTNVIISASDFNVNGSVAVVAHGGFLFLTNKIIITMTIAIIASHFPIVRGDGMVHKFFNLEN